MCVGCMSVSTGLFICMSVFERVHVCVSGDADIYMGYVRTRASLARYSFSLLLLWLKLLCVGRRGLAAVCLLPNFWNRD